MAYFDPLRPSRVKDYYVHQHLTQREIGRLEGITGPAVCKILRKLGIPASAGTQCELVCPVCGCTFTRERAAVRKTRTPTCSPGCYRARRRNPATVLWRQGQRIARAKVRKHFPLAAVHVVHHADNNNRNNTIANLWVFASQSDHMKFHHGGHVQPLWRGDKQP